MHLESHIRKLLQENNCVVVPDFGGFLTHYHPAQIIKSRQVITPPAKKIAYNAALQSSDGLLINHIAKTYSYRYAEAEEQVAKQVDEWKQMLQEEKKLHLQDIGTCTLNDEGSIYFSPDQKAPNLLLESFGMEEVEAIAVERQKPSVTEQVQKVVPLAETPERKRKWGWIAAAAVILIGFFLLLGGYLFFTKPDFKKNLSGFFTGLGTREDEPVPVDVQKPEPAEATTQGTEEAEEPAQDAHTLNQEEMFDRLEGEDMEAPAEEEGSQPVADNASAPVAKTPSFTIEEKGTYYIIGGSFSRKRNAEKLVRALEQKGYSPDILNTDFGYFRVSVTKAGRGKEADSLLNLVRQNENSSAWILIK